MPLGAVLIHPGEDGVRSALAADHPWPAALWLSDEPIRGQPAIADRNVSTSMPASAGPGTAVGACPGR